MSGHCASPPCLLCICVAEWPLAGQRGVQQLLGTELIARWKIQLASHHLGKLVLCLMLCIIIHVGLSRIHDGLLADISGHVQADRHGCKLVCSSEPGILSPSLLWWTR